MEKSGRQKFEESWREAFEDSEMEPSGLVWNNIDQKLDNDKMKRRVVFYQRLAAAAVIFALLIGVGSTSYFQFNRNSELASKTNTENNKEKGSTEITDGNEKTLLSDKASDKNQSELNANSTESIANKTKIENSNKGSEEQLKRLTAEKQAKENESADPAEEKLNIKSIEKTNNSSNELLASSANKKEESKKQLTQSGSQQASVKSNSSKQKNDDKKSVMKTDDVIAESLISQNNKVKNVNDGSNNELNQITTTKSKSFNSKNEDASNNNVNDVTTSSSFATVENRKMGVNTLDKTNPMPSSDIQSGNAFSRLTSLILPQLKNNKLPKGMEAEPKRELPEMPASMMVSARSDKRSKGENTWLSFGAAAGSYNPGSASSYSQAPVMMSQYANTTIANAMAPASTTRSSVGSAYSVGFSVGKKIADRWIVHTGLNYMNQAIAYTSSYATYTASNDRTAFVADYADKTSAPIAITQPYKVNSSNEFVSLPVQTGYMIVDRKFGWQWNAGIATDVFLRNTLKDQSGQSDKYTQGSGDDSPYRSFNFAALTSTEFSYKLGGQYRISLVPGIRYSFQSVLKSQSGSASNPLVLDIGFRFRYIFNKK